MDVKKIILNTIVLFVFMASLTYAANVLHVNSDTVFNGVSFLKQGGTLTAALNGGNQQATNFSNVSTVSLSVANATMNETGIYYGTSGKVYAQTVDNVICKGENIIDDVFKFFSCSKVCYSFDTNCYSAIQSALNQSGSIIIRTGNYTTTKLTIYSNTYLKAEGNVTIFHNAETNQELISNYAVVANDNSLQDENIYIEGITFDGNMYAQTGTISWIRFKNTKNLILRLNNFNNGYRSIVHNSIGSSGNDFRNEHTIFELNTVKNNYYSTGNDLFQNGGVYDSYYLNNIFIGGTWSSLTFGSGKNVVVSGNIAENLSSGHPAFSFEGFGVFNTFTISDNQAKNISSGGFNFLNAGTKLSNIILSNPIVTNSTYGIVINSNTTNELQINKGFITNTTAEGIYLSSLNYVDIQGTVISNVKEGISTNSPITVRDVTISNAHLGRGIYCNIVASENYLSFMNGCHISDSNIDNVYYDGINLRNSGNSSVINNRISNSGTSSSSVHSNGIILEETNNSIILNNFINSNNGKQTYSIRTYTSNNNTFLNNVHSGASVAEYYFSTNTNYIDDYEYSSNPTICASNNVFSNRWITNTTNYRCRCDSGVWRCIPPNDGTASYNAISIFSDAYYATGNAQGMTNSTGLWFCTTSDCSTTCPVVITDGLTITCAS